jgi:anaerobic magnesium-protoporphyrin IX monomethyl ester cyclase
MRVLFVAEGFEQLPVSLLGAILRRQGHTVGLAFARHLFDDRNMLTSRTLSRLLGDEDIMGQVVRFRPDVVCFSALTFNYRWMLDVARGAKDLCGAVTVFGGVHPSGVPDVVLEEPAVDYVCVGEGEVSLPLLLKEIARGGEIRPVPNVAFRRPDGRIVHGPRIAFWQDLDRLPGFEKDLWQDHIRLDLRYFTMSARGCPYRCTFCFNNFFANLPGPDRRANGSYVRQRSVGHFLAELKDAKRRYRIRGVEIFDDIFTLNTAWLKDFAREYRREIGVPFTCLSHVQFLDEEKVRALKDAGCSMVSVGVESADDEYKKIMRRHENSDALERALTLLDRAGIPYTLDHIFGLPGENPAAQQKALELYARHNPARVISYWLAYLPGTEMFDTARRQGQVSDELAGRLERGHGGSVYCDANVLDGNRRHEYLAYSTVFRLLPLLPAALRRRIQPAWFRPLPAALLRAIGLAGDLAAGWLRDNPKFWYYLNEVRIGFANRFRARFSFRPARRFGPADAGPLSDPAWDAAFAEAVRSLPARTTAPVRETVSV